jgi:type IV pilus assembly protein PilB
MIHGEGLVMRILDKGAMKFDLRSLGMEEQTYLTFRQLIDLPHGIVLVTGPTGSGKTTTLYSALIEINAPDTKIITTEDPVEYQLEGINQIQVHPKIGLTFGASLRSILRIDPDVGLVGEIRDLETAENAIQASLTGHLVFSTLHTNDAPSTITRLKDMGVPTFLITATVEAILAQRLVRRICPACREEVEPTEEQLYELSLTRESLGGRKFYRGSGCTNCNNTGYKGRIGMFELLIMDDELREMIMNEASADELRATAKSKGMRLLRDAGEAFIYEGKSTAEEVIRETILES